MPDPSLAVTLGSSFLGYHTHAGFLNGLAEQGIHPGHLAGSSAGALAAGIYASGIRGEEFRQLILSPELKAAFRSPSLLYRWIPLMTIGRAVGLLDGERMVRFLTETLPTTHIQRCTSPTVQIGLTNVRAQEVSVATSGDLARAIVASCSIPWLFKEQHIAGNSYFDGGLALEYPIDHWLTDPAIRTVVIHRIRFPKTRLSQRTLKSSPILNGIYNTTVAQLHDYRVALARAAGKEVIVCESEHPHPGLFPSAEKKETLYETGRTTGQQIASQLHAPS